MKKLLLYFCLCVSLLRAQETELFISIPVHQTFYPLYITKVQEQDGSLPGEYLQELYEILTQDFSLNGKHSLLPYCQNKEKLSQNELQNKSVWKTLNVAHVLKLTAKNTQLHAQLYLTSESSLKTFPDMPLTGDLNRDRVALHALADTIFSWIFKINGIASTKILFAKEIPEEGKQPWEWPSEIWECDYDGANSHQITYEKNFCISPVSAADGSFYYINYKHGQPKIYQSSIGSGAGKGLISLPGNQLLPALSKKGDKLAFICDASGRADLFLQHLDAKGRPTGKPIQLYSYPRSVQASPTFSPDGRRIAFVSDRDGTPRIYLISLTGSRALPEAQLLTKQNRENICPSWSPDGTKIVYSAKTNGTRQIWIYDFEKKEEKQLTFGPHHKENPNWALSSKHIVFNTTDPSYYELYIFEIESGKTRKISDGPGKKHYPNWSANVNPSREESK